MNSAVDFYFDKSKKWQEELNLLRILINDCGLQEILKWGVPCYTLEKTNVVLIHTFKEYCAILFFKGALLKDTHKILIQQTKNVQSARQIRFTNMQEVNELKHIIKQYIHQAIAVEKAGLKMIFKENTEFDMPEEFQSKLDEIAGLQNAFTALTPGRQRAYLLYFAAPKQSATKVTRVEKYIPTILAGKGLND